MLAPCGLNLQFYIFFSLTMCKKNHKYQYQDKKNLNDCSIHMTPIKHHNNTPLMESLNPKCDKNKYKKCQILKLQNENETKNKNLSM
jgi:hypothetical protein